MKESEINIAIAEACGWKWEIRRSYRETPGWYSPQDHGPEDLPNYCGDLNCMHEAEKTLTEFEQRNLYVNELRSMAEINFHMDFKAVHATARQRAHAFLKVITNRQENKKERG